MYTPQTKFLTHNAHNDIVAIACISRERECVTISLTKETKYTFAKQKNIVFCNYKWKEAIYFLNVKIFLILDIAGSKKILFEWPNSKATSSDFFVSFFFVQSCYGTTVLWISFYILHPEGIVFDPKLRKKSTKRNAWGVFFSNESIPNFSLLLFTLHTNKVKMFRKFKQVDWVKKSITSSCWGIKTFHQRVLF